MGLYEEATVHYQIGAIVDENGDTLNSHGDICARWGHHFLNVLNVPSSFHEEVVSSDEISS